MLLLLVLMRVPVLFLVLFPVLMLLLVNMLMSHRPSSISFPL